MSKSSQSNENNLTMPINLFGIDITNYSKSIQILNFFWQTDKILYPCPGLLHVVGIHQLIIPLSYLSDTTQPSIRVSLRIWSHRNQQDSNPRPLDREARSTDIWATVTQSCTLNNLYIEKDKKVLNIGGFCFTINNYSHSQI